MLQVQFLPAANHDAEAAFDRLLAQCDERIASAVASIHAYTETLKVSTDIGRNAPLGAALEGAEVIDYGAVLSVYTRVRALLAGVAAAAGGVRESTRSKGDRLQDVAVTALDEVLRAAASPKGGNAMAQIRDEAVTRRWAEVLRAVANL